ncbi:hypothetical protein SLS64_010749 [Diaporthe eres]|uniref:ADF-H domain-containing protein n=2 Tax=Diaporthe eres species complex TaxID=2972384 RepID=A0ABR1NNP8_DIAER|nr:uncharacterized protein INS49_013913 [Diaporthe citri]KAG6358029.1 hypothetical protein INS49_013913 [Diaporthe citri]KAI7774411.1 hypothetical protein LA080_008805 [Diaporthe eres]
MSGINSPELLAAYEAVRSDKDETKWLLISSGTTSKQMGLQESSSESFEAMVDKLADDQIQYAYARVEYANDSESTRVKFALIIWNGPNVHSAKRFKMLSEVQEVKKVLHHYSKEFNADDKRDLVFADIVKELRRSGGADYNGGRG